MLGLVSFVVPNMAKRKMLLMLLIVGLVRLLPLQMIPFFFFGFLFIAVANVYVAVHVVAICVLLHCCTHCC